MTIISSHIKSIAFLASGGEMGALIHSKDWTGTPVGNPENWPQSLRTTLSIVLNSKFPMFLFWGPELICFYNDAYRPSLGQDGKHPSILGTKAEEAWTEIWTIIKPLLEQVLAGGESTWSEDQLLPIYRNGKIEDAYWTFSYSAVTDEMGEVAGVLTTCTETTAKVIGLKRLKDSKEELEFAIEATELGTFDYCPQTDKFASNERLRDWFGLASTSEIDLSSAINVIAEADRERVINEINKVLVYAEGGNYDIEYTIVHPKSKTERIINCKGKVWFNDNKIAYRFNGTLHDVTERVTATVRQQQILDQLSETSGRLQLTLAAGKLGSYEINIATGEVVCTTQCKINFGLNENDRLTYSTITHMVVAEDRARIDDAHDKAILSKSIYDVEYRIRTPSNEIRWIKVSALPIYDELGVAIKVIGVTADTSLQKNSEIKIATALQQIEQDQKKLNIVIEAGKLGIWELDLETKFLNYSKRYLEIIGGYTEDIELNHDQLLQHLHPDDLGIREQAFQEAYKTGYLHYQSRLIWHDKSLHWMEGRGKMIYDENNKPLKLIGVVRDITNEKEKEQELLEREQKFRLLADSMPQHIWTSDPKGTLNYFNKSVYDYSGLESEKLLEVGWLHIVHPDEKDENTALWTEAIKTGKDFLFEHRFRRHDGVYRWQLSRAIPQRDNDGNIRMWVGTSTDIEDQKNFSQQLEKLVQERTLQLEQKNIDLENMNKELESFAYISSHDLQEPLRKIQTFSSQIVATEIGKLSDEGKDNFQRMQNAAQRMQTLIEDLLLYSRTNTTERKYVFTDLKSVVTEIIDELKEDIQNKRAIIELNDMCSANIITFQFKQLMQNLITNSLKFSHAERSPHIKISADVSLGKLLDNTALLPEVTYCHIRIMDNGIGFEQQYSERIFQVFQRLHGRSEYKGTGIGLSIVKKIVDNHNGIITAHGEHGKGATFHIYFPVNN